MLGEGQRLVESWKTLVVCTIAYPSKNKIESIGKMLQSVILCFSKRRSPEFWVSQSPAVPRVLWIRDAKADSVGPLGMEVWWYRQTER